MGHEGRIVREVLVAVYRHVRVDVVFMGWGFSSFFFLLASVMEKAVSRFVWRRKGTAPDHH